VPRNGQSFDNITELHVFREPGGISGVKSSRQRYPLKKQRGARIEIIERRRAGKAAAILKIFFYCRFFMHRLRGNYPRLPSGLSNQGA
jgi:hypothetical protein